MQNKYYVYRHIRLDKNTPFYVGKGQGNRVSINNITRNKYWHRIVNKYGYKSEIIKYFDNEDDAYKCEQETIRLYRRFGFCEANLSKGGEGNSGYKWTSEQKLKHSKLFKQQTSGIKDGHIRRSKKLKGRTKYSHDGVCRQSKKVSGSLNGRYSGILDSELIEIGIKLCKLNNNYITTAIWRKHAKLYNLPQHFSKFRFDGKYSNFFKLIKQRIKEAK